MRVASAQSIEVREENIYEFEIDNFAESMGNNRFKLIINRINIGINRNNNDQTNFIAYPVPFKSELFIANIKNANVEKIELFNSIGELQDVQILNDRSNTININTEKLNNSGVYILRIHTNDNQVSNIRIMK